MIERVHDWVVGGHVAFGFFALVVLWVPLLTKKGGSWHVRAGKAYVIAMLVVVASAAAACVLGYGWPLAVDGLSAAGMPAEELTSRVERRRMFAVFLGYLALVTFQQGWHGLQVLRHKGEPGALRRPATVALHSATVLSSGIVLAVGLSVDSLLLMALSPIGALAGGGALKYAFRPSGRRMAWWFQHMGAMIGTAIAANTAFLVFGANRLLPFDFQEGLGIVVWLLPAAVGTVAIRMLDRKYGERFEGAGAA